MKIILILILITFIMVIAIGLSNQYKDKFEFYNMLQQFLQKFKLNLSFKQEKIEKFLNAFPAKGHFKSFIEDYKTFLKKNEIKLHIKCLDDAEILELTEMIKVIGNHDVEREIVQLDGFITVTQIKLDKAKQDMSKMCPMILKLSLLFAIALVILLI